MSFSNNPLLPWQGDFTQFCATDGSQQAQVGAPCDNGNPLDGTNDVIQSDCRCGTYDCVITDTVQVCPGSKIPVLQTPFTNQVAFDPPWAGYFDSLCQCVMVSDTFSGYAHVFTDEPGAWQCFEITTEGIGQNSLAAPSCAMVMDTFCDLTLLDVGCARMPSPPLVGPAPSPLCNGQGTPHNMSWFSIVAGTGSYTIEIVPSECTTVGNEQGMQAGIYTDCTFTETVACFSDSCYTGPIRIPGDVLTPGNTYLFWINGCNGSVCNYAINVLGNFEVFEIKGSDTMLCNQPNGSKPTSINLNSLLSNLVEPSPGFWTKISGPTPGGTIPNIDVTGMPADTIVYEYTSTANSKCTPNKIKVAVVIEECMCTTLNVAETVTNTSCGNNNGAITLNVSGGTAPYMYAWTGGLTGASSINVASGTYTVTVTGSGTPACTATETYTVGASTAVTATNVITPVSCGQANGSITLTTSGGTGSYTYAWTGGLTGSNPAGLNAGNYTVTIIDSGTPQCSFTATYNVPSLSSLAVAETLTQPTCGNNNGAISVNVTGGIAPYTYAWTGGLSGIGGNNLAPGNYTVTVTDSGSPACSINETYTLNPSSAVTIAETVTSTSCGNSNGAITLNVSGGTGPYTYAWTGGLTGDSPINVASGTYTVTVTGSGTPACTATETYAVGASMAVTASAVVTQPTCGLNNGSIVVSPGPAGYTYAWTGGLSGQNPVNVAPGTYTVTVTQTSTGCTATSTAIVNTSTALTASVTVTQPTCGLNNGSISVSPGPTGYTYAWTGGLSGQNPVNVAPGTYTVTVTQTSTGCTATSTAIVNASTAVTASAIVTQPTCGQNNGSISVSPGPTGYTYEWTSGLSGQNPMNVGPGTYTVTVTQTSTGCTAVTMATLDASTTLTATATTTQSSCGKNNGSIRIDPSGAEYTYSWTGGLTGPNPNNAGPGTYSVTVTQNTGGCTATVTAVVTEENNTIEAEPDSLFVKEGQTTQLNILTNDTYPAEAYTLKLGELPQEYIELISFEQTGVLGIEPVNIFSEPVTSTYKLCNKCEDCVEGTLYFIDDRLKEIILVTMITPKEAANNRLQFSKDPIPGMEVWVYNRWGQQVYHSKDYQNDWDASGYAGGVYYYVLKVYGLTIKKTLTVVK